MERAPAGPASACLTSEVLFSFAFQAVFGRSTVHATSAAGMPQSDRATTSREARPAPLTCAGCCLAGAALIMLSVGAMMLAQKRAPPPATAAAGTKQSGEESCAFRHADSQNDPGVLEAEPDGAESELVRA